MKRSFLLGCICLLLVSGLNAQEDTLILRKGIVLDSLQVRDSIAETFALYLPTSFKNSGTWPVLFVVDLEGRGKEVLRRFRSAAEEHRFIMAASNNMSGDLPVSDNILIVNRMIKSVNLLFPVHNGQQYTAGFGSGAKMASLVPVFIKQISGVISIGAPFPNYELLSNQTKFYFVGVVGREDFHFNPMRKGQGLLRALKIPNELLIHDGGFEWPSPAVLEKAIGRLSLYAMKQNLKPRDSDNIAKAYQEEYETILQQIEAGRYWEVSGMLGSMRSAYIGLVDTDTLDKKRRSIRKHRMYKTQSREMNNLAFREGLLQDEFEFSLLQDLDNLNYNNLGWWNYQMKELKKYEEKPSFREKQLGKRLIGYVNALVEDNIDIEQAQPEVDGEAVSLLWMIKTITDPTDFSYYLKIISDSARYEDFGTALFYLEELLKLGYEDKEAIYSLEHTALLRIMPEFNKLIGEYLDAPRYKLNEQ